MLTAAIGVRLEVTDARRVAIVKIAATSGGQVRCSMKL
ncbi:hypothetical protein Plim_0979 [Planctopirus limnophila DSM 3776]|uniref:Uncharacterized protein n=1 Tax=Planctopirus limnophila (strain ATCC 43296 / DSM 3776 / IFAM 1008 / Mu 290) TaxID=521674 RepID=D5ST55_PLAL2|nr:hypothetical protein Plim_0979 [Planctopirus limnophila DSM 3776]